METEQVLAMRAAQARLYDETGPGSFMGKLLRRFWHPVARVDSLGKGLARPLRILGEDLTLYRGESGAYHLVGERCAHRGTVLHTGWVEGESLRCMYHGWRFAPDGACVEIPAESQARARAPRIAGYPTRSYAGLVFAFLGEGPAPDFELPRKPAFEDEARILVTFEQMWDCHWFHQIENSLDPVHIRYAHNWGKSTHYGSARMASSAPELSYEETTAGVRQRATTRATGQVRVSDWTFPNNNHIIVPGEKPGDQWSEIQAWTVPVDDENTLRFRVYSFAASATEQAERMRGMKDYNPTEHQAALFSLHDPASRHVLDVPDLDWFTAQDYVAMRGQGRRADRINENLSTSDAGVLFLRRLFLREMEAIRDGGKVKRWMPLAERIQLPVQTEAKSEA